MLALQLDSYPQATLNGQPLPLHTRHELALLVYLALEPGPHPRQLLSQLLWPQAEPEYASGSLRVALFHLRQRLGAWLTTSRHTVALHPSTPLTLHQPEHPHTLLHAFALNTPYDTWLHSRRTRHLKLPSWATPFHSTAYSHLLHVAQDLYWPILLGEDHALAWVATYQAEIFHACLTAGRQQAWPTTNLWSTLLYYHDKHLSHRNPHLHTLTNTIVHDPTADRLTYALARFTAPCYDPIIEQRRYQPALAAELLALAHGVPDPTLTIVAHLAAAHTATQAGHYAAAADHQQIVMVNTLVQNSPHSPYHIADAALACARSGSFTLAHGYLTLAHTKASESNIPRMIHYLAQTEQAIKTLLSHT